MRIAGILLMTLSLITFPGLAANAAQAEGGTWVQTPYQEQKVLFDFYFDQPGKIKSALYWIRAQMNPLILESAVEHRFSTVPQASG